MNAKRHAVIISLSSDIGAALGSYLKGDGWLVSGTHRRTNTALETLMGGGVNSIHCDLESTASIDNACTSLSENGPTWDYLILCPGMLEPVGLFESTNFDEWSRSYTVNYTNQLRIVHKLLPSRNLSSSPMVLFFAGGGVNNATLNYSAYTSAKIGLIKMCELLDAEIEDTRFSILGPGWVRTKIHEATLQAGKEKAGANYDRTQEILANDTMTPMQDVIDCCLWLYSMPREAVSGRNFSVVYDEWRNVDLRERLISDENLYKLRRFGNE